MMCIVRRLSVALAGLVSLAGLVTVGVPGSRAAGAGATPGAVVRTLVGHGQLDTPGGIALDAAGDLFIADTGHCRVLVVPARDGTRYGLHLHAGRAATVAGGSCAGVGSIGHPSGVAVDAQGDVYIAEATAQRVQVVRPAGRAAVTVAGTGRAGFNGDGLAGPASELDEPAGVAVDGAGDVFIADTANCRVRVLPATTTTLFGQAVTAGHLSTVGGTGVCGSAGQGGPLAAAQLWNPVAVAVDGAGDLLVADDGDQSVLLAPVRAGTYYGTTVGAGDIGVVVGGAGSYQPYLADGAPAAGETAELNDPRGIAVGPTGALFVTDGFMRVIRVAPATSGVLLGRTMTVGDLYSVAGALPVATATGPGNGTRWVLTRMGTPSGVAVSPSGAVYYSDSSLDTVRMIGGG
jgi:sugar lactone lactonase YvrE